MTRAHLNRPILDAQGNVRLNATIRVFATGTGVPTSVPLFTAPVGPGTKPSLHTASNGVVDFYTEAPQRFDIGIRIGDEPEILFPAVDVLEPSIPADGGTSFATANHTHPGIGTQSNQVDLTQGTGSRTLTDTDSVVFSDGTDVVLTLPDPTTRSGRQYTVKNLNVSPMVLAASGSTIDGSATRTLAQFDSITVISNGTNWGVV